MDTLLLTFSGLGGSLGFNSRSSNRFLNRCFSFGFLRLLFLWLVVLLGLFLLRFAVLLLAQNAAKDAGALAGLGSALGLGLFTLNLLHHFLGLGLNALLWGTGGGRGSCRLG